MGRAGWSSRIYHAPRPDGRSRDVFPLPVLEEVGIIQSRLSRSVQRRVLKKLAIVKRANQAIRALNSLFSGKVGRSQEVVAALDDLPWAQRECIRDILKSIHQLAPPPPGACGPGALQALRAASNMYEDMLGGVGDVVPMELERLSLPSGEVAGVELVEALEEPVKGIVQRFEETMLQDADVWTNISRNTAALRPYNDPSLRSSSTYLWV